MLDGDAVMRPEAGFARTLVKSPQTGPHETFVGFGGRESVGAAPHLLLPRDIDFVVAPAGG